jgi:uncharacterized protein (TIGR01370 family)
MMTGKAAAMALPLAVLLGLGHARADESVAALATVVSDATARAPAEAQARPAVRAGFGIQYWGEDYSADGLAAAPHCALIIEASLVGADTGPAFRERLFSATEVDRIRHQGARPTYAYLNLAELAVERDYWTAAFGAGAAPPADEADVPAWYAGKTAAGEPLAAYWTPEWEALLRARIDALLARGFDGVFLDDVLHYYTWSTQPMTAALAGLPGAPKTLQDFAREMMALVLRLGHYARVEAPAARPGFALLVNGGAYIGWDAAGANATQRPPLFADYLEAIDGIAIESALGESPEQATLDELIASFAARGVPVLTIDFASRNQGLSPDELRALVRAQTAESAFLPYVADDERFARLDPPLLPDAQAGLTAAGQGCPPPAPSEAAPEPAPR